jgi:hypothetical protein
VDAAEAAGGGDADASGAAEAGGSAADAGGALDELPPHAFIASMPTPSGRKRMQHFQSIDFIRQDPPAHGLHPDRAGPVVVSVVGETIADVLANSR